MDVTTIPSPCFVLDEAALRRNLELLANVQETSGATVLLALKGFALFSAFPMMRKYISGVTASSLYEARLGHEEFIGEVHACAPVYVERDFDELCRYVSHITFNSLGQWARYKDRIMNTNLPLSPAIRINPEHAEVETALYNPGMPGSRLGVPADELGETLPEGIEGLHFHTLCECNSDALERTLDVLEKRFAPLLHQAQWLNMGGGHHITRADYDVDRLVKLIRHIKDTYEVDVILEPGEAFGWQTGVLVATVEDIVTHSGQTTIMLDTSFSAHMPDCLEMPYKPAVRGARDPEPGELSCRLGGMTCLAGDFVGDYVFESMPKVGDRIILEDMMHYTMVKTTMFNGVHHPAIGIQRENGRFDLIREFGYADYRNRLS